MSRGGGQEPAVGAPPMLELPPQVLVAALTRLAGADTRSDVAASVPALLLEEPGVRGCAVVVRDGSRAVVLGSAGYGCGTMSAGAALPLDAGLPVTDAVRSGRLVQRGTGPSWVAAPFGGRRAAGALLLSLVGPPPSRPRDTAVVAALARALGDALRRAQAQETAFLDLALVTATLAQPTSPDGGGVAIRRLPHDGVLGSDVAMRIDDGDATWLVVADVHRRGLEGAAHAHAVATAATAVVPHVCEPADLVHAVRRALADSGPGPAVSVSVARAAHGELALAASQAPAPALLSGGRVTLLEDVAGRIADGPAARVVRPARDAVLVLHSDGLTRRAGVVLSLVELIAGAPSDEVSALADHLVRTGQGAGPADDDVTVLVARLTDLG